MRQEMEFITCTILMLSFLIIFSSKVSVFIASVTMENLTKSERHNLPNISVSKFACRSFNLKRTSDVDNAWFYFLYSLVLILVVSEGDNLYPCNLMFGSCFQYAS